VFKKLAFNILIAGHKSATKSKQRSTIDVILKIQRGILIMSKYDRQEACESTFACEATQSSHEANWKNIGLFRYDMDACETPEHTPKEHAIVVVHQPLKIKRRLGGELREELIYPDRNVVINPAHVPQSGQWNTCASFSMIFLDPKIVAHAFYESIDPDEIEIIPHFSQTDPLINSLAISLANCLTPHPLNRLYTESIAITLSLHLIRTYGAKKLKLPTQQRDSLTHQETKLIAEYITTNLHQDLSLFHLATLVNKSVGYFGRCFLGSFGHSPGEYIKDLRLNRAVQLLTHNPLMRIEEVASRVGLRSINLRRLIRLKFGVSASSFRDL
jgi:AraC family transcriptional regulator